MMNLMNIEIHTKNIIPPYRILKLEFRNQLQHLDRASLKIRTKKICSWYRILFPMYVTDVEDELPIVQIYGMVYTKK